MFSMTGLQPPQIQALREEHQVYLLPSGRISVTGCESRQNFQRPSLPRLTLS